MHEGVRLQGRDAIPKTNLKIAITSFAVSTAMGAIWGDRMGRGCDNAQALAEAAFQARTKPPRSVLPEDEDALRIHSTDRIRLS